MIQKRAVIGGGASAEGCLFYFADGNSKFISSSNILGEEYEEATVDGIPPENWAIRFEVSDSKIDQDAGTELQQSSSRYDTVLDGDGEEVQTAVRLLIRVDGRRVNLFGIYSEEIACINGSPIVQFYKNG